MDSKKLEPGKVHGLWASDVKSLDQPDRNGFNHYVIYNDEFSDYISVFGIKSLDEAASTVALLEQELALDKLPFQVLIQPDGTKSTFDNARYRKAIMDCKFNVDFSPPYTPEDNKAERAIQRISIMARAALVDAPHLDFHTHAFDAVKDSVYKHNRIVGSRGKTPFELVKKHQPPISHLRSRSSCNSYLYSTKCQRQTRRRVE